MAEPSLWLCNRGIPNYSSTRPSSRAYCTRPRHHHVQHHHSDPKDQNHPAIQTTNRGQGRVLRQVHQSSTPKMGGNWQVRQLDWRDGWRYIKLSAAHPQSCSYVFFLMKRLKRHGFIKCFSSKNRAFLAPQVRLHGRVDRLALGLQGGFIIEIRYVWRVFTQLDLHGGFILFNSSQYSAASFIMRFASNFRSPLHHNQHCCCC